MAMSKQELLESINSTIVKNGNKGITAETLSNVLIEMVESSGEGGGSGSGDGALRIKMCDSLLSMDAFEGSFTPENLEALGPMLEMEVPGALESDWYKTLLSAFEHNAKVYQKLLEKTNNYEGTFVIADFSETTAAAYKLFGEITGEDFSDIKVSFSCIGPAVGMMGVPLGESDMIGAYVTNNEDIAMSIILHPNGGIEYVNESTVKTVYVNAGGELDDFEKSENTNFSTDLYNKDVSILTTPICIYKKLSSESSANYVSILYYGEDHFMFISYEDGSAVLQNCTISADGEATITTCFTFNQ